MRDSWRRDSHQLLFHAARVLDAGHAHADLLAIECAPFGRPAVVDPGTYCYTAAPRWREHFRGTAAHSTVTVDGLSQATPGKVFRWDTWPRARLLQWRSDELTDYADAEHDGYERLADPVVHRRRLLFVKPRFWVVVDDLTGADHHHVELRFQLAQSDVVLDRSAWARANGPDGRGLLVRALSGAPITAELREGQVDPPDGWISPDYGHRVPAPVLVYSFGGRLPLRIVTVLMPRADATLPPPRLIEEVDAHGAITAIEFDETGERIGIDRERVWLRPAVAAGVAGAAGAGAAQ